MISQNICIDGISKGQPIVKPLDVRDFKSQPKLSFAFLDSENIKKDIDLYHDSLKRLEVIEREIANISINGLLDYTHRANLLLKKVDILKDIEQYKRAYLLSEITNNISAIKEYNTYEKPIPINDDKKVQSQLEFSDLVIRQFNLTHNKNNPRMKGVRKL